MGRRGRFTTVALVLAAALLLAGCGSSGGGNPSSNDGGVVPADAALGTDGLSCPGLSCLANATALVAYCAPSGTCTEQLTISGNLATMTKCFSNGVKIQMTGMNLGSGNTKTIMSVKKDGAACYSFIVTATADQSAGSVVYRDGAGADLFTEAVDGNTTTYACPGGPSKGEDTSCDPALRALQGLYPFTNETCPSGTCTF